MKTVYNTEVIMKPKRIWKIWFSPTGGTKTIVSTIADTLSQQFQSPLESYDFTLLKNRHNFPELNENDLVIFGTSVIAGRVPNVLLPYLKTIKGNHSLAVPVVSFGNRNYDDALIELRNLLENASFQCIGAGAFISEHAFSTTLAKHRPDEEDIKTLKEFAYLLYQKIEGTEEFLHPVYVNGQTPLRPYYMPQDRNHNPINILKVKPVTSDTCVQCGICANVCPMETISFKDARVCQGICIKCNACVKACPYHAKSFIDEGYLYHKEELEIEYANRKQPEYFL